MKHLLTLVALASIAGCSSRVEDQAGAAPDTGDTTGVTHAIDTTRTGPPGTGGRPGNATVTTDSVLSDTVDVMADTTMADTMMTDTTMTDTTTMDMGESPSSAPQDTLGPRSPDFYESDTTGQFGADTSGM